MAWKLAVYWFVQEVALILVVATRQSRLAQPAGPTVSCWRLTSPSPQARSP
jgi:hypothetical protein